MTAVAEEPEYATVEEVAEVLREIGGRSDTVRRAVEYMVRRREGRFYTLCGFNDSSARRYERWLAEACKRLGKPVLPDTGGPVTSRGWANDFRPPAGRPL